MDRTQALLITTGVVAGALATLAVQRYLQSLADSSPETLKPDIRNGIEECIGNTPLIRIKSLCDLTGCEILGKAEFLEPGGSVKDRVALNIITLAETQGHLTPHTSSVIYEGTVGSTGLSLALLARARGYLAHIFMPNDQSLEKSQLLTKLGARTTLVPPAPIVDKNHFVNLARAHANSPHPPPSQGFFADQFETEANHAAHHDSTGPEIYAQTAGRIDAFICGAGTGGTLSGIAQFLKKKLPDVKIYVADPPGSGLYNKITHGVMFDIREREGTRRRQQVDTIVEGIGINRLTRNFQLALPLIDGAIRVHDPQAMAMAKWLVEKDGLFLGSSSAVNCFAAVELARRLGPGHTVVTILCDSGARHLSKFWKDMDVGGDLGMTAEDLLSAGEKKVEKDKKSDTAAVPVATTDLKLDLEDEENQSS
ncbi:tryptophan synthase beta subunit-like PLP-dependent enzyme [Peziza echinospora]|nr:tryptophan synthase beta subunit-like PLP-dependent enzyme [Peziza echinospora]